MKHKVFHEFKPVIDESSEILILGSIPSVQSRKNHFYYMHPRNRFWSVLTEIFQVDFFHASISEKKTLLKKEKIALYDVIESCDISNSSDASITNVTPVDIQSLIRSSSIKKIYLNGKKAYHLFLKYNPTLADKAVYLPSTSPANARFSREMLVKSWLMIKK